MKLQSTDSGPARCPQAALSVPGDVRAGVGRRPGPEGPERAGVSVSAVLQRRDAGTVRSGTATGGGPPVGGAAHAPARARQQHFTGEADGENCRVSIVSWCLTDRYEYLPFCMK